MGVDGNMEGEVRAEVEVEVDHVALDFVQSSGKDSRDKKFKVYGEACVRFSVPPAEERGHTMSISRLGLDIYNAFSAIKVHRNQKILVNLAMQSIIYLLNMQNKNRQ
jgi:hypothetical protein